MPAARTKLRVIVDTNCWISFLIGRRLARLTDMLADERIELVVCDELLDEISEVTSRPKFRRYFRPEDVASLMDFMSIVGFRVEPQHGVHLCRDEADDHLLSLALDAKAHYLVTGDDDLLALHRIGTCKIVDVTAFEALLG